MSPRKRRIDKDLLLVGAPAVALVIGAFALTLILMRPAPPSEIVMSTGTADGTYHAIAQKYRDILERLDEIEEAVNHIETPLAYSENLYVFRQHIDLVRQRAQSRIQRLLPAGARSDGTAADAS